MNTNISPASSLIGPWLALFLFIVVFAAVYAAVKYVQALAMPYFDLSELRTMAAFRASASIVLVCTEVAALFLILKLRGQTLEDLGWSQNAPLWGWLAAVIVVTIYVGFALGSPMLKGAPILSDWSAFRIIMALGIAITAGFGEELLFRGFVMTQARDGGASIAIQILLSALLFGMAHGGWGGMATNFNIGSMIGAIVSTSILGLMLALVYVFSNRSLMPVIFAHFLIDLIIEPWLMLFVLSGGFEKLQG